MKNLPTSCQVLMKLRLTNVLLTELASTMKMNLQKLISGYRDLQQSLDLVQGKLEAHHLSNPTKDEHAITKEFPGGSTLKQDPNQIEGLRTKSVPKVIPSIDHNLSSNNSSSIKKVSAVPEVKETMEARPEPQYKVI